MLDNYDSSEALKIIENLQVFHKHNNLPNIFSQLKANEILTIGEISFCCALNFLKTLQSWRNTYKNSNVSLHYLIIESSPPEPDDLAKAINKFPEFLPEAKELLAQYYLLLPGYHRLSFADNVLLTLVIGDINGSLQQMTSKLDVWLINELVTNRPHEEILSQKTCKNLARLSHHDTTITVSTPSLQESLYNLKKSGFEICNSRTFDGSSTILYGQFMDVAITKIKALPRNYYAYPQFKNPKKSGKRIIIIGAGISGASTAYSLAQRGYLVTVYEETLSPAMGASGNYQAILYGTWSAFDNPLMELSCCAYRYSHHLITSSLRENEEYASSGLIQLSHNSMQRKKNQQLMSANLPEDFIQAIDLVEIEKISGMKLANVTDGIYFPYGIWLKPQILVNKLLSHPNIELRTNCKITKLDLENEQIWKLYNAAYQPIDETDCLVICNSYSAEKFDQLSNLKLCKTGGQVSLIKLSQQAKALKTILCHDGYMIPSSSSEIMIGATFNINEESSNVTIEDHYKNLNALQIIFPELISEIEQDQMQGMANTRASVYDRLPLAGPIAKYDEFNLDFNKLRHDKNAWINNSCRYYPGLYLNIAHGSKGMLTSPYCGELIADYIDNTTMACSESLRQALHPNRIYARKLIKGVID